MQVTTLKQNLILISAMSDPRVPRNCFGYIEKLLSKTICKNVKADSVKMLSHHIPDLMQKFINEEKSIIQTIN